jgi:hypothetical protein
MVGSEPTVFLWSAENVAMIVEVKPAGVLGAQQKGYYGSPPSLVDDAPQAWLIAKT